MRIPTTTSLFYETFLVWVATLLLMASYDFVTIQFVPVLAGLSPLFLLYVPVFVSMKKKRKLDYVAFDQASLNESVKWFAISTLVIYALAFPINHVFQTQVIGMGFVPANDWDWLNLLVIQIFFVGLPEEFFFRGYMQENFNKIFPTQRKIFGAKFGFGVIITCIIFTLSHSLLMKFQPWQLLIFFPALVFAWLKEKTGTIWASVFFHAISNMFSNWVFHFYR